MEGLAALYSSREWCHGSWTRRENKRGARPCAVLCQPRREVKKRLRCASMRGVIGLAERTRGARPCAVLCEVNLVGVGEQRLRCASARCCRPTRVVRDRLFLFNCRIGNVARKVHREGYCIPNTEPAAPNRTIRSDLRVQPMLASKLDWLRRVVRSLESCDRGLNSGQQQMKSCGYRPTCVNPYTRSTTTNHT
jgi:hypothetical protein